MKPNRRFIKILYGNFLVIRIHILNPDVKMFYLFQLLERQANNAGLHDMQELPDQIMPTVRVMQNKNINAADLQSGHDAEIKQKKRNSYADSPHRLVCPYCPRAFPWISSLNRHILTHTGKKNVYSLCNIKAGVEANL